MTDGLFLSGAHLGEGPPGRGVKEQGVIAEAALPLWLAKNNPVHPAVTDGQHLAWRGQGKGTGEVGGALLRGNIR